MPMRSVELSAEAELVLERELESGAFADESHLFNEALLAWDKRDYPQNEARLRELLAEGIAQYQRGEFITCTVDEIMEEAERELETQHG